jgi:hypothetical protein
MFPGLPGEVAERVGDAPQIACVPININAQLVEPDGSLTITLTV